MDTFKRTLLRLKVEGMTIDILHNVLLVYKGTQNNVIPYQKSPEESFMSHRLRTNQHLMLKKDPHVKNGTSESRS